MDDSNDNNSNDKKYYVNKKFDYDTNLKVSKNIK